MTSPETPDGAPLPGVPVVPTGFPLATPAATEAGSVSPVGAPVAPPPPPARRSRVPWIVGGVIAGLLLISAGVVAALLIVAPWSSSTVRGPEQAVLDYDRAYDEVDCELFASVTTVGYRERIAPTCEAFEQDAQTFVDNFGDYEVVVESTAIDGGTATVVTTESWTLDGASNSAEYTYTLLDQGGSWRIDALD